MTLAEIIIAMALVGMMFIGIFSMALTSRRLTEAAVYQNAATTVMQGYIEQMKNMDYAELLLSPAAGTSPPGRYGTNAAYIIPTRKNESSTGSDTLVVSPLPVIDPTTIAPGTIPSTVYDNIKTADDVNGTVGDMKLHIWLWVEDKTPSGTNGTYQIKAITFVYTWEFKDGSSTKYTTWSVRSMRSLVPTF